MRRSVFLALWLSLVLSLSKETAAQEPGIESATTTPTPTESTTAPTTTPTAPTTTPTAPTTSPSTAVTTSSPTTESTTAPTTTPTAPTTSSSTAVTTSSATTESTTAPTTSSSTVVTTSSVTTVSTTAPTTSPSTAPTTSPSTAPTTSPSTAPTTSPSTAVTTSSPTTVSTTAPTTSPSTAVTTSSATTESSAAPTTSPTAPTTSPSTAVVTNATSPENSTTPTKTPATTEAETSQPIVDFCHDSPCGRNSAKCISLYSNFTCECDYGFYYTDKNCYRGQVYPATIEVQVSYNGSIPAVNSTEYEELFYKVSKFFEGAFKDLDYEQTVIVEIRSVQKTRNSLPLNVTVTNLFMLNATVNDASVVSAVQNAISTGGDMSFVSSYKPAKHCDVYQCDTNTAECYVEDTSDMTPECKCKPGLAKTQWDDRSCSVCSESCSADKHKYCVYKNGAPSCECMINFKRKDDDCVACAVGFSGEGCTDNSELILIIVGTVLGAITLSLVIAVSVISARANHKQNPEKRRLIKPGYSDSDISDSRPSMFPRVQTTSGHANPGYQPNNPYEMRPTNRGHFPERDYDDLYEISREPGGFRMQSRY